MAINQGKGCQTCREEKLVPRTALGVLETVSWAASQSTEVHIDLEPLERFCERLSQGQFQPPSWNYRYHFYDATDRTVVYLLIVDSLNFCFWGEPQWQIQYQGEWLTGYWALAASLRQALEEGFPLTDASYLAQISLQDLRHTLRGKGEIPLLPQRQAILHEVGSVLKRDYQGKAQLLVERAERSAVKLVQALVQHFPSFRDEALYQGRTIRFYKRAQIFVADLYSSFQGEGWGEFSDLSSLTACADYKLPQVLRHLGILKYSPSLTEKVDQQQFLSPGSKEEVEIRANTLWAVELLRRNMRQPLKAVQIDRILWGLGQREEFRHRPHHCTRTIYY